MSHPVASYERAVPVTPSDAEAATNPRSRSAKMRVAERISPEA